MYQSIDYHSGGPPYSMITDNVYLGSYHGRNYVTELGIDLVISIRDCDDMISINIPEKKFYIEDTEYVAIMSCT